MGGVIFRNNCCTYVGMKDSPLIHIEKIEVHYHNHIDTAEINSNLNIIKLQVNKIIMKNEELLAKLDAANAKADKIIAEIQALKELVNTTPDVPQNIVDAVNSLESKLQAADDLNEDAPPPTE